MPLATIHVLTGHPRPTLKALLREFSATYARIMESPVERLQVWIQEIDPELYAIAGEPADEALARGPRGELEIPLIRLVMMEGRPQSQADAAIQELSACVARHLGGDPARVRVEIQTVPPERWGIGGTPASVLRRAEIEARRRAG
ncbi:MAG: tautomerase family protein [Myxococcales bacterium]|nr:tautomerase family protein [Myxococcales bacterium]MCB9647296.1 tautomerase family protein [Deltaproteobacteria bacterium]